MLTERNDETSSSVDGKVAKAEESRRCNSGGICRTRSNAMDQGSGLGHR